MVDKKIKDFTKGIEEIAKLHPADQEKVFQMVADQNGTAAAGYVEKKVNAGKQKKKRNACFRNPMPALKIRFVR